MDHIHVVVKNVDDSLAFYRDMLGLEARSVGRHVCLSPRDAGKCIIYIEEGQVPLDRANYIYHFALLIPSRADLGALLEKILDRWNNIEGYADHLVSEAIYLRDPDNIGLEIYSDRGKDRWARDSRGYIAMDTLPLDIEDLILFGRNNGGRSFMPPDTVLGHIHLRGSNPGLAGRFYSEILGMRLTGVWFGARFLAYGDYHHHVAINSWPIPTPNPGSGLKSYAINIGNTASTLRDMQPVSDSPCGARGLVIDPNGFKVEIL